MPEESREDFEVVAFIDALPNLIRMGQTKEIESILRKRFEKNLPRKVARYGELQHIFIKFGPFNSLMQEARSLYVDQYYRAAVALCGMTVEALCIAIAEETANNESLKEKLTDPSEKCRKKIRLLKNYLKVDKSASLLNQVLNIRKKYIHLHETRVVPEEVLRCINTLHLAVFAEYGLVPAEGGKVRFATKKDVEQHAGKLGMRLG